MKKITIIGLGWLGLPLAEHLQKGGWKVVGTKRNVDDCPIECYKLDLNEQHFPQALSQKLKSQAMVIAVPPSKISEEAYLNGIQKLVVQAVEHGLKHLIFISSTSVLPQQAGEFDEKSAITCHSTTAKLEQWLQVLRIDCDVLRLAGLVGKQRHPVKYLAGKIGLSGANQPVNLVHLEDCIAAISLLLENPKGQRIFHLCAPRHPTREAFYQTVAAQKGLQPLQFLPDNQPLERIILAEKICEELGFQYLYPNPYEMPSD